MKDDPIDERIEDPRILTEMLEAARARIAELERTLANTRELWRIANENANARLAETERWKGIQQEACAERDTMKDENAKLREFVDRIAKQRPEKPDFYTPCGQCGHNIEDAKELTGK